MAVQTHVVIVDDEVVNTTTSFKAALDEVDWLVKQGKNARYQPLGDGWHVLASWSCDDRGR